MNNIKESMCDDAVDVCGYYYYYLCTYCKYTMKIIIICRLCWGW